MAKVSLFVWILTICGNVALALFLVAHSYYIRFGWLTVSTTLAVAVDALLWWCHTYNHHLYEPLRLFIFYCLFWMLNGLVIWEAWRAREPRVQIPVEIQLGLALVGLLTHRFHFPWFSYYFECSARIFNLCVIAYFVSIFSKENKFYEPRP
jgi:hypothetical protein